MLSGQVLNSDAQVNNFVVISSKSFIAGEEIELVVRILNPDLGGLRFVPNTKEGHRIIFADKDGSPDGISIALTGMDQDYSIMKGTISAAQTQEIVGGNANIEIIHKGKTLKGIITQALTRVVDGVC